MIKNIKKLNELLLGPLALVLWFYSPDIIRWFDPTAAVYDTAVFQKLIFGLITFSLCHFSVWIMLRITFPELFKYMTEQWDKDFKQNPDLCQKQKLSFLVFACYLLSLLLAMLAL